MINNGQRAIINAAEAQFLRDHAGIFRYAFRSGARTRSGRRNPAQD
jgi:hypothetical protein